MLATRGCLPFRRVEGNPPVGRAKRNSLGASARSWTSKRATRRLVWPRQRGRLVPIAPIEALKVDEWDRQIDVNIKGLLHGVAAALPHMQKQKSGHIINMASVFGIKMFAPGGTVYCATKAAVRALTEGLRMELHSQNIRCTMISPGAIATELSESSSDESTRKNLREFMKMAIPASMIARAIAYAIEQPVEVEVDEIVIRPTVQDF